MKLNIARITWNQAKSLTRNSASPATTLSTPQPYQDHKRLSDLEFPVGISSWNFQFLHAMVRIWNHGMERHYTTSKFKMYASKLEFIRNFEVMGQLQKPCGGSGASYLLPGLAGLANNSKNPCYVHINSTCSQACCIPSTIPPSTKPC